MSKPDRTRHLAHSLAATALLIGLLGSEVRAAEVASKFLRYADEPGKERLETSVVRYVNKDGVVVDLIGAVHIGDADYFATLNEEFKQYEAVLYEMVKPRGMTGVQRSDNAQSGSWISSLQLFMTRQLDLSFQLDRIDYEPANFVHADLDAETFLERQAARGENMASLMLNSMLREMNRTAKSGNAGSDVGIMDLVEALQAPDRARQLKLVLARQFEQMDEALDAMGGPGGSVILDERNQHALKVLREQIDAGKKRVAIFYGAGHMRGMEELMTDLMGFKQEGSPRWVTAWDLADPIARKPTTRPLVSDPIPVIVPDP